jgi:hypothetical protein
VVCNHLQIATTKTGDYEGEWTGLWSMGTVPVFRQDFALEDAIGSHACSLETSMHLLNGIPLGWSL